MSPQISQKNEQKNHFDFNNFFSSMKTGNPKAKQFYLKLFTKTEFCQC